MRHSWYRLNYESLTQTKRLRQLVCNRCERVVLLSKQHPCLLRKVSTHKTYCDQCLKRDFYLINKVRDCIRLMGGTVSMVGILRMYEDEGMCCDLLNDPFSEARLIYNGDQKLQLVDLQKWIHEGIFKRVTQAKQIRIQAGG